MTQDFQSQGPLRALYDLLRTGQLNRRAFIERATVAGASLSVAMFLANTADAVAGGASTKNGAAFAAQRVPPGSSSPRYCMTCR